MAKYLKEIEIEIYYIDGGDDWFSMVLTRITSRFKKIRFFIFSKTIEEKELCDSKGDEESISIIKAHLKKNMSETTGTERFFPHKIKFLKGYDSHKPWAFSSYYPERKSKIQELLRGAGLKF